MSIEKAYLIEKRNMLNEFRPTGMTLQELRLFSIYLAKINARDACTRTVRFSIEEYLRIMEFKEFNFSRFSLGLSSILQKVVDVPLESGGFDKFQLFKKITFSCDKYGWFIELTAHDDALPLMFEFKEKYFTYELWNALSLKSANQIRMYEILKQYEHVGERVIELSVLREMLGIKDKEYPRFSSFKERVIEACQEALEANTDIKFTYEPEKRLARGKIHSLKFKISRNEKYVDRLSLNEFMDDQNRVIMDGDESYRFETALLEFVSEACDNEFSKDQMRIIYNLILAIIPSADGHQWQLNAYNYLKRKYDELRWRARQTEVKSRFGYLKKLLEIDLEV